MGQGRVSTGELAVVEVAGTRVVGMLVTPPGTLVGGTTTPGVELLPGTTTTGVEVVKILVRVSVTGQIVVETATVTTVV